MYVRGNSEAPSHNYSRRGKAISITYSERVSVALVIQHAKRCAILSSMASLDPPYFPTLSHKRHDLRIEVTEQKRVF